MNSKKYLSMIGLSFHIKHAAIDFALFYYINNENNFEHASVDCVSIITDNPVWVQQQ
jgi:hypothetical protein